MNKDYNDEHRYDDIINTVYVPSLSHPHMKTGDRAAQFAPFSPLSGYGSAIKEKARLTDEKIELDEYEKAIINEQLKSIQKNIKNQNKSKITYFVPDEKKSGGRYEEAEGEVRKIDQYTHEVIMKNGLKIAVDNILGIELEII